MSVLRPALYPRRRLPRRRTLTGAAPQFGEFVYAVFPRMAGKRRPGVFVDALVVGAHMVGVAVPATATRGHQPGALALPEPPAPGLRPSRLLVPYLSALPIDRFEPLGAALAPEASDRLRALLAHWFGEDWRLRDPSLRAPFKGARRLHPRSGVERRRALFRRGSGDAGAAAP